LFNVIVVTDPSCSTSKWGVGAYGMNSTLSSSSVLSQQRHPSLGLPCVER
jgi:hypothetical protein